jgi:nitrite reductase/ring-hydroxylating ferredoxin subunit
MQTQTTLPLTWHDIAGAPAAGLPLKPLAEIPDGGAVLLAINNHAINEKPFGIILLRSGEQAFAYVNRCAHFGVPLAAKVEHLSVKPHQSISCSVHYARYRWQDGVCEFGECLGEALIPLPITIINGMITLQPS